MVRPETVTRQQRGRPKKMNPNGQPKRVTPSERARIRAEKVGEVDRWIDWKKKTIKQAIDLTESLTAPTHSSPPNPTPFSCCLLLSSDNSPHQRPALQGLLLLQDDVPQRARSAGQGPPQLTTGAKGLRLSKAAQDVELACGSAVCQAVDVQCEGMQHVFRVGQGEF